MEQGQDPEKGSSYTGMSEHVDDTELLLRVSLDRLISIANDYAIYIGGAEFLDQSIDAASDRFFGYKIDEYDSSSIIEFQTNLIKDQEGNVDYTHYYLGIMASKGIHYSDLPHEIQAVVKARYDAANQKPLMFDGEEHSIIIDIEDAECSRVESVDINFDSNKHFQSWTGVHFDIDGDAFEIDEYGNVDLLTGDMPTRRYRSKNDFDENLIISTAKVEQDIAVDQIEEAMNYMSMLIDKKYGSVE